MKSFTLVLTFVFCYQFLWCQNEENASDSQLAYQYFQSKEFDKAGVLYEKLFKETQARNYFLYAIKSYIALKEYDRAEKLLKKELKRTPVDLTYFVELSSIFSANNMKDKYLKNNKELLKKTPGNVSEISRVTDAFLAKNDLQAADEFLIGIKNQFPNLTINFQKSKVYLKKGEYGEMMTQLFEILDLDPSYLEEIQNLLVEIIEAGKNEIAQQIIKKEIIKKTQKNACPIVVFELLTWFYIQQADYERALIQLKSIDKRNKESGNRIMQFARQAFDSKAYEAVIESYKYMMTKGSDKEYYYEARVGLLNVYYAKLEDGESMSQLELIDLEIQYRKMIDEYGISIQTVEIIKNYAHLLSHYLNKPQVSIEILTKVLTVNQITNKKIAELKLELADSELIAGNKWNAILIYAQVDDENKQSPIGAEAKFRRAKLAYLTGDFKWAQSQLDILKASTTKLIANDAMDLSIFISENQDDDSLELALNTYVKAELFSVEHKDSMALSILDSLIVKFPQHALIDDVLFKKGIIFEKLNFFSQAIDFFMNVATNYPQELLADDALYFSALIYENDLKNKEKAMENFKKIIEIYPSSIRVSDARRHFRQLRGDFIENKN